MRLRQVIIFEQEAVLASLLQQLPNSHQWRIRNFKNSASVLPALKEGIEFVLIPVGRDLLEEMALLEQITWSYPETITVVIGRNEHPDLAGLAWDLGARFVLFPPFTTGQVGELVNSLLDEHKRKGPGK